MNYRESLWKGIGGPTRARAVNRELAPLIDVMLGNEEDFTAALGFEVEGLDGQHSKLDVGNFQKMIERAIQEYVPGVSRRFRFREIASLISPPLNSLTRAALNSPMVISSSGTFHR